MSGLIQPTLTQIQNYLKVSTLGEDVNTTSELKDKIKANVSTYIIDNQGFYFGYETDVDEEPIIDANNFKVAFTSKKTFILF